MSGFVVWLTGLSAAGKSTIAGLVAADLEERELIVERLDGDVVREHLTKGLGFSKEDRDENIARIGWVASRLARAGAAVVVSAISPYEEARQRARELVEEHAPFVLVYVATSLEECERRDPKSLYKKARSGELREFTGVSDPYEVPENPELRIETEGRTPEESAQLVLAKLEELDVSTGVGLTEPAKSGGGGLAGAGARKAPV
jgi:adenylyl-sulfate kinase